jgi:crossover junction endodeoxyribonuclease RuvC
MKEIVVMGVDPGLAHLGYALVELNSSTHSVIREGGKPLIGLIETSMSDKKRGVKVSDDNTRRAREVYAPLLRVIQKNQVKVICAEAMSFPRSSSASHKMGISWGIIVALSCQFALPITQATPTEIKKAVCGSGKASKQDVQDALSTRYDIPLTMFTKTQREHPFDALGAVEACLDSEVIQLARSLIS